jgi:CrcB protein
MKQLLLVGLGGALGAIARWRLGGVILRHAADWKFPVSTFLVNLIGCLIAGVLAGLTTKLDLFTADTRLFLFTGLLGGFTTFSAFGLDTVTLLRRGDHGVALAYVLLSVGGGVTGLWLGMQAVRGDGSH